jgi:mycofactocin precursor
MTTTVSEPTTVTDTPEPAAHTDEVLADLLVEEISIDGMCGVY